MVGLGTLWTPCRKTEVCFHLQISFFNRKKIICQERQNFRVWQILISQKEEHMTTISLRHTHRKYKEPDPVFTSFYPGELVDLESECANCTASRGTRLAPQAAGAGVRFLTARGDGSHTIVAWQGHCSQTRILSPIFVARWTLVYNHILSASEV